MPWLALIATAAAFACTDVPRKPHPGIEGLWRDFLELPRERALAIAGDPNGTWVAGGAGGEASRADAEKSALAECARKRAARRLQVPCMLYATGEEIVWPNW